MMNQKIIPSIVSQHAEEAAFIWLLRDGACCEPQYDLNDLAQLDERLDANLDGLRIAGEPGWEICQAAMALQEPGEIFAAGVMAFESNDPDRMDALLSVVEANVELQRALVSALGWIPFDTIAEPAGRLLGADLAFLRYIGLAAHAVHRKDPGECLIGLLNDEDETVRARGLKAAGELGRLDVLGAIKDHYQDEDASCRFYAVWSGALLGDSASYSQLMQFIEKENVFAKRSVDLAARCMGLSEALAWLDGLALQADNLELAVQGYGSLGDPSSIPLLLEWMQTPDLARKAGESFSMITGVDMENENLSADAPEGFNAGPNDDPDDENVGIDLDEDLPWPNFEMTVDWWRQQDHMFQKGTRYLAGQAIASDSCRQVLRNGFQRQRLAAALELACMHPGQPFYEVRGPGFRQQRSLAQNKR